jgi:hypothetical protein
LTLALTNVLVLFMAEPMLPTPQEMTARHAATLARIAEAAERLAMKHAERALAADDPDVEAKATIAFHRAARSVRQCLALEAKLVRDAARFEREAHQDLSRAELARSDRHKAHVRKAVERLIWTEAETDDTAERLCDELDDLLDIEAFGAAFADEPVEAHIARLCAELGVVLSDPQSPYDREPAPAAGNGANHTPERRSSA